MTDLPVQTFRPDRGAYVRAHAWMAALFMALAMAVLWWLGNPHVWTGAVAALGAVALRGWYLSSEELSAEWQLTGTHLNGPGGRRVPVDQITQVRRLGSAVQVIAQSGDKHLIKYQADPKATVAAIERVRP